MKKYRISLQERIYEVLVEELEAAEEEELAAKREITADKFENNFKSLSGESETIKAPISGNILDMKVKIGENVKSGQTLLIIEAMKLENEIVAPRDGKVVSINVSKGDSVTVGVSLISLQ